jgi:hypothetical protein
MTSTGTTAGSRYSLHPAFKMELAYHANLKERTGRTLDEWVRFVKEQGPPTDRERTAWLKDQHGLTTNYAAWVVEAAAGRATLASEYDPDAMVEAMFAGPKAALRPIYDRLLDLGLSLGPDVKACPCKTIVPLYRQHVFAEIKPTTNTRIDLGLALRDTKTPARLIDTGGFAKRDRITRRIAITGPEEIDGLVVQWLRRAYDMDGPAAARPSRAAPAKAAASAKPRASSASRVGARSARGGAGRRPRSTRKESVRRTTNR